MRPLAAAEKSDPQRRQIQLMSKAIGVRLVRVMAQLEDENASGTAAAAWISLRYPVFRYLWIVTVVSNIGSWMYSAASGWLMTSLNADPLIVSLVQVANSLPLFLFALPAGAVADITDKRRLILALEILTTVFSALFATLVTLRLVTPTVLLWFLFLIASLGAIESPAWQAIVPLLVPTKALSSALATNSVGVNISRVLGPALAGIVILSLGIAAPFWLDAVSNLGVIAVIIWWRAPARPAHALPAEHLSSAMRAGARYVRNNPRLRATLVRAVGFFLPASAYWALLPLVARGQLHGGPTLYGILLGAIGAGAVGGVFLLPGFKAKSGPNWVVAAGEIGTGVALLLFGLANNAGVALLACLIAGVSWIGVLATLNVSAQMALPDWVRGRGLAIYVAAFFGTMSVGSIFWGFVAQHAGLPTAHFLAAAGAILALIVTSRWKLYAGPQPDLTPSMHWPEPVLARAVPDDVGPVMVTVEYRVAPADRQAFLTGIVRLADGRKRDGAYDWGIFEDTAHPGKLLETFLLDSWLEHLRQHQRVTNADRIIEEHLRKLLHGPPRVTHYVAVQGTKPQ
jgi:MFS family permease